MNTPLPGDPVVTINGARLRYQGIARVRADLATDLAVTRTRANGVDEVFVSTARADGRVERRLIYGDDLDLRGFKNVDAPPDVRVDGERANLLAYEDEPNALAERLVRGLAIGVKDAAETVQLMATKLVEQQALTSTALFLGGTAAAIAVGGGALGLAGAALASVGPLVAGGAVLVCVVGVALIVGAGVLRQVAFGRAERKGETIAGVVDP